MGSHDRDRDIRPGAQVNQPSIQLRAAAFGAGAFTYGEQGLLEWDEEAVAPEFLRVGVVVGCSFVLGDLLRCPETLVEIRLDTHRVAREIPQALIVRSGRHQ